MTLREMIKVPLAKIRLAYYTEDGADKPESDVSIMMFTAKGLERYKEILNMDVVAINKEKSILYLKCRNEKGQEANQVDEFWSFLTHYGPFHWNINDRKLKVAKDELYFSHKSFFTYTDENTQ